VSESDNEGSESKESSGNESDNDGSASESEVKMKTRVIERYHMPVVTSTPNSILSYINWVFILNLWIDLCRSLLSSMVIPTLNICKGIIIPDIYCQCHHSAPLKNMNQL
jgi:hypothetical protein